MNASTPGPQTSLPRTLVAGIGNILLGDDGFGSEVARRLAAYDLPEGARVTDYGIRGTHLAYDLLDGWDALIMVDTLPPRGAPGTVHVLEICPDDVDGANFDLHGMDPNSVLASLTSLGGTPPPTLLVGCEPARLDEGIGLSALVAGAVPRAVEIVLELLGRSPEAGGAGVEKGGSSCVSVSPVE